MKQIRCSGNAFEIGFQHGTAAKTEINRSLVFYKDLFGKTAGLGWPEVCDVAGRFEPMLRQSWSDYCEEMQGLL